MDDFNDQERNQFWEVYYKVDNYGKKGMAKLAGSLLAFQMLSEGKKSPKEKAGRVKKT